MRRRRESSATRPAASRTACARRSPRTTAFPPPPRPEPNRDSPVGPMRVIDVMHLGRPHVIGCWEVDGALVDPGPESSISTVLEALGEERPRAVLLTHIHLDHAAATGALVRRWPDLEVYVHERGAPHLIDPSKLLASAERLYGDKLGYLWGEILPVPEANVTA